MNNLYSKNEIITLITSKESISFLNKYNISTLSIFGSLTTNEFNEMSDIDIAIIRNNPLPLDDILDLELFYENLLNREIDIIDLKSNSLDLFVRINILNNCKILYSNDNNENFNILYDETEIIYNENKNFFHFRKVDVLS